MSVGGKLKIISGSFNPVIAESIAKELEVELCSIDIGKFANGETSVRILESVRGHDVFIIQSHYGEVNNAIMEQAIIIDAAKRASAKSITAICPFMAYARQDRKSSGREPITARLVTDILTNAGASRIVSIDLHTGQIQGFANVPFDHLTTRKLFVKHISREFDTVDTVIVSPDAGRVKTAERYSNDIGCDMAIIHKSRSVQEKNKVEAKHLIGDVKDRICIIIDDMIDTAGTICAAADLVHAEGAKEVYAFATHGLFSDPAISRINGSSFKKVITTDTVPHRAFKKLEVLSVAPMVAESIKAIHTGGSVSSLFDGANQF